MNFPDCLYEYCRKRLLSVEEHFAESLHHCSRDSIHDLRVEIKRLRAFLEAMEGINTNFSAGKTYRPLRDLFKKAGKIRDCHVLMEMVENAFGESRPVLIEYYGYLKDRELEARHKYLRFAAKFDLENLDVIWKSVNNHTRFLSLVYFDGRLNAMLKRDLNKLVAQKKYEPLKAEEYHLMRINIKAARYLVEIMQECHPTHPHLQELNEGLRICHQALGAWHDFEVGIGVLKNFIEQQIGDLPINRQEYDNFLNILDEQRKSNLSLFEARWGHFIKLLDIYRLIKFD